MSSTAGSRSGSLPGSSSKKYVDFDEFVAFQLEKARSGIRANDLLMGAVGLGVFVASYLFVFLILDQWVFAQGVGTALRVAMWLGMATVVVAWIAWKVAGPFLRRVTSLFAAKEIEAAHPDLKSNLLTLIDLRQAGREVSPQILQAIEKRAAVRLSEMDIDHAIDRRTLMRWSYVLLAIVAGICIYTMLTPKRLGPSLVRALIPITNVSVGTQTRIEKVIPENANVLSRSSVEIIAQLTGKIPEQVKVLYSTEDRRFVDEPLILADTGEGLNRFRGVLSGERAKGLMQSVTYRVEAGDAISPTYTITVTQPPSATVADVAYDYPTYMGLQDRTQANPTIDGWEGTRVTLRATTNRPVQIARVLFSDTEDTSLKAEELPMKVDGGTNLSATWMLQFRSDGTYPHFYRIFVKTEDGSEDPAPVLYPIRIRQDLAPKVEIIHPQSDVSAPANGSVQVAYQASDPDFLLKNTVLRYEKRGQELPEADYVFEAPPLKPSVRGVTTIDLNRFAVVPGDKLTFWLEAKDNLEPFGNRKENVSKSARINIDITDAVDPKQAQQKAEEEKQRAKDELDQAPPPPQEDRGNPQEQRPEEQRPEEGMPEDGMPQEGMGEKKSDEQRPGGGEAQPGENPNADPGRNNDNRPMPGDEGMDNKPGEPNGGEGQPKDEPRKNDGQGQKGAGQAGTPQDPGMGEKRDNGPRDPKMGDDPKNGDANRTQQNGTAGQRGGPGTAGQPQREGNQGEGQPQPQRDRTGNDPSSGAGQGERNSQPGGGKSQPQREPGGGNSGPQTPMDRAPDDVALERLLNYSDKKGPEADPKPPQPDSNRNQGSQESSPGASRGPDSSGSRSNDAGRGQEPMNGSDPKSNPEKGPNQGKGSGSRNGTGPMPSAPDRGNGENEPGKTPMKEPGGTDMSPQGTNPPGRETERPSQTPGNMEKNGPREPKPGTGSDPSAPPERSSDGNNGMTGEPGAGNKGTNPPPAAGQEKGPGAPKPNSGAKPEGRDPSTMGQDAPMPGTGERPMPSDAGTGEKPAGEMPAGGKQTGQKGPGNTGTPMKSNMPGEAGDTGEKPMGPGEAPMGPGETPMPGEGADNAPGRNPQANGRKPDGAGKPDGTGMPDGTGKPMAMEKNAPDGKPGETEANANDPGAKPNATEPGKEGPMPGTGEKKPGPGGNTGEKRPQPGEGTGQKAPAQGGMGEPKGQPGAGEKPMRDDKGRPAGGDPQANPMGAPEQPSANSKDQNAQRSPNPMQGGTGRGQDSAEGQPGGKQRGMGDTSSQPGQEGTPSGEKPGRSDNPSGPPQQGGKPGRESGKPGDSGMPGESGMPMENGSGVDSGKPGAGGKPMPGAGREPGDAGMNDGGEGDPSAPPMGDKGAGPKGRGTPKPNNQPGAGGEEKGSDPPMAGQQPGGKKPGNAGGDQPEGSGMGPGNAGTQPGQAGNQPGQGMGGDTPGEGGGGAEQGAAGGMGGTQSGPGGGRGGAPPPEGGRGAASTPNGPDEGTDLNNRKKSVNLMLNRLQEEIRRGETDPQLLKELGFTENDLQQFLKRLDDQLNKVDVTTPEGQARQRQFEELLRGLNANTTGETRAGGTGPREASGGFGTRRSTPPTEYAESAEAYKKRLLRKKPATP